MDELGEDGIGVEDYFQSICPTNRAYGFRLESFCHRFTPGSEWEGKGPQDVVPGARPLDSSIMCRVGVVEPVVEVFIGSDQSYIRVVTRECNFLLCCFF